MALSAAVVDSSLTFPSAPPGGPLAGLNSYVTPMTKFVGPQAGDINTTRSGPIELFSGDMCIPAAMHCSGCVIVATTDAILGAACSFEAQYLTMYATGAAAVICERLRYGMLSTVNLIIRCQCHTLMRSRLST